MKRTRRIHGAAFKTQVAFVACKGDKMLAEVATHVVRGHPAQTTEWKLYVRRGPFDVFGGTKRVGTVVRLIC